VDPMLVIFGGMLAAFALVVILAGLFHPKTGRSIVGGSLRSDAAEAEIEAVDIEQMIEARNERRRRAGRPDIGDELARQALGEPPERLR
jgi:hypothetical protein